MAFQRKIEDIQRQLQEQGIDGWLLYDHHGSNRFARELLGISSSSVLTRRFFYWIPQVGEPSCILHRIEAESLDFLPGKKHFYLSWLEWESHLKALLKGVKKVAMEYSPLNHSPYAKMSDHMTAPTLPYQSSLVGNSTLAIPSSFGTLHFDLALSRSSSDHSFLRKVSS